MTLKYDTLPANIIGNTLFIAWWNGSKWLEIPSTIDPVNKTVTAQVSHFTDYVVMGKKLTTNSPPWSLIISIIILVIFIIFIIFFLAWRRRKKQEEERRIERI
jgi:protein-S-isoprenylcysteine O-methyltransferase Ste14